MLKSMTGFGQGEADDNLHKIRIEIRSLNHRYLEVSAKIPERLKTFERKILEEIKKNFSRGKLEIFLNLDSVLEEPSKEIVLDLKLAENFMEALKKLKEKLSIKDDITLSDIVKNKEIFTFKEPEAKENQLGKLIEISLSQAIRGVKETRLAEGNILERDIRTRILNILSSIHEIEQKAESLLLLYKDKLQERIKKIAAEVEIDPVKIEEQVVLFAEKSDITEEIVRAKTHLENFLKLLETDETAGRKMDFYIQEINREVNTIGSKSSSSIVSESVIQIKVELEKIREQVQNVE